MRSAFGVEHTVSKRLPDSVPDWASGAMPASSMNAYNRAKKHKVEAAGSNFLSRAAASAAGAGAGIGLAALALKSKKAPKLLKTATTIPMPGRQPVVISAGEKQRYAAGVVGSTVGGVTGGYVGQRHLKRVQQSKHYMGSQS